MPILCKSHLSEKIVYTREMVVEIARCKHDLIYFADTYCSKILHNYRKDILKSFVDNRFNVIKNLNETDETDESLCVFTMWIFLFNLDKTIAVFDIDNELSKKSANRFKNLYENLPIWLRCAVTEYNTYQITSEHQTKIFFRKMSEVYMCGECVNLLICNNLAFVDKHDADNFWKSQFPTIYCQGSAIVVSPPNGTDNIFYDLYKDSEEGKSCFVCKKIDSRKEDN